MPELTRTSPDNPEFARVIRTSELARIGDAGEFSFDISPEEEEFDALARLMDARNVRKLRFSGTLAPEGSKGFRLVADLGATVIQTCVVTLEPVTTRIDQQVRRSFLRSDGPTEPEIELSSESDEETEPLTDRIDLGLIATEALALALPDYPRKPGASLGPQVFAAEGVRPLEDKDLKPFASLAALRKKLGDGS